MYAVKIMRISFNSFIKFHLGNYTYSSTNGAIFI